MTNFSSLVMPAPRVEACVIVAMAVVPSGDPSRARVRCRDSESPRSTPARGL